jgi:glutathione S-transferase
MTIDLKLYTNPRSRGAIARWMLEETGVPYETEIVELGPAVKTPEYLAINPMGKVPALVHGDVVVTETAAICAYLADTFPDARLAPPQNKRGAYYRWLFFAAGPLEAAVTAKALGLEAPADRAATVGYGTYARTLDTLERAIRANLYIAGDRFTAADVYVGAHVVWGLQFGNIEERPAFAEYRDRVSDRPAHKRAAELDAEAAVG